MSSTGAGCRQTTRLPWVRQSRGRFDCVDGQYTITNTGNRQGAEASQVYLTLPAEAGQPSKRLVGFQKVELMPGASQRVTVTIDSSASNHPLSYWVPENDAPVPGWAKGNWRTAPGDLYGPRWNLVCGNSARSDRTPFLRGNSTASRSAADLHRPAVRSEVAGHGGPVEQSRGRMATRDGGPRRRDDRRAESLRHPADSGRGRPRRIRSRRRLPFRRRSPPPRRSIRSGWARRTCGAIPRPHGNA